MEKNHGLVTRKPKNELLKKQIAYYYFHLSNDAKLANSFYFYPNYLHALTIYKGSDISLDTTHKNSKIRPSSDRDKFSVLYTVNANDKIHVSMEGNFHKIGVVFYPLGFNHFIDLPLNQLLQQPLQEINLCENFNTIICQIDQEQSIAQQLDILESALLAIYRPFQENTLQKAIKEIVLSNGIIKVDELEKITAVSRKTLLRLFKKHTYSTMESYKKMVMFRNSLNYALQKKELVNLTDIALYNMYYDQSHYIKHFKSITRETPKTLLPKIVQIGNEDLYWHFSEEN